MPEDQWPKIAVMGAGAVGCYFGGMLAHAGAPVTLIGRAPHVEAITRSGLCFESRLFDGRVSVRATTDLGAAREAEIVLFSVKTLDTESAAKLLEPHLAPDALVISLQNGVDNVERIRSVTRFDPVAAVVYVAAAMAAPGHVKHSGRGDLILGEFPRGRPSSADHQHKLEEIAIVFKRAGIPCLVSDNIEGELWTKMIMNCVYNAMSALSRSRYGSLVSNPLTREVMRKIVEESVAVARAAGVRLPDVDIVRTSFDLGEAMSNAMSSTAQDVMRGKKTEIDSLNGYVVRRGAELGVPTPVNQTLHALVKVLEEPA